MRPLVRVAVAAAVALAACQAQPPAPEPQPIATAPPPPAAAPPQPPPVKVPTEGERALADGVALYDAGDFNGAIKWLLGAKPIWDDSGPGALATKVAAHKIAAFSYCVTNRRTLCRQQFVEALRLDPGFVLEPAEKTHPVWGVEFERAKAQAASPNVPARRSAGAPAPSGTPAKGP